MSDKTTQNEQRPSTKGEAETDIHVQHLHRVFGRNSSERNTSQKYVFEMLENIEKQQSFQQNPRTYEYDPIHAALREGERNLARAFIMDIKREPVSKTTKPIVTK